MNGLRWVRVLVGDALMERVQFDFREQVTLEIDRDLLLCLLGSRHPDIGVSACHLVLRTPPSTPRDFPETKEVDAAYAVHHLVEAPGLRDLLYAAICKSIP